MDTNTKMKIEKVLNYTKNIVLSLVMLFTGLFLVPVVGVLIFLKIADPVVFRSIAALAPIPIDSWSTQLVVTFFGVAPFIAFIVWAVRDSRKFVAQGLNTRPFLWGIGMVFPLILVVFPLYFVRRNITWVKEKQEIILANKHKKGLAGWWSRTNLVTENTKMKINKGLNVLKWTAVILVGLFGLGVLFRIPFYIQNKKTDEQVAKIHATKLTMDDVMGVNLPPDPGAEAGKTVAGIDINENGIRDDVELAIFKEYPNSAKTRAVLLQYALALQMEVVQPFENERNVTEVVREEDRADSCVADTLVPRETPESWRSSTDVEKIDKIINFVKEKQFDTQDRKVARNNFFEKLGSYASLDSACDIDYSILPN